MIGPLHDLTCEGPVNCTCSSIRIAKPTPKAKQPKPLKSRPHVIPSSVKQQVFERDQYVCRWCNVPGGTLDCHHVLPRSQGGKDRPDDLVAVHRLCHDEIHRHPRLAKTAGFLR